jgi:hypothetical protein
VGLSTYSYVTAPFNVGQNVNGIYYLAGGGGGSSNYPANAGGGYGGGGTGIGNSTGIPGTPNTGGGGGASAATYGGAGGSGVAIIWYQSTTQKGTGGNIIGSFVNGGNTYWAHIFTVSGAYIA